MKHFTKLVLLSCLAMASFLSPVKTKACNLTDLTLISLVQNGGNWDITATLCIGYGVTGFVQGADQLTSTIAAFFYGPGGGPIQVLAYGPAAITSTVRGCTMLSIPNGGPIDGCVSPDPCGPPYFSGIGDAVWITDNFCDFAPPCAAPCDIGFTCILTTALCGNVGQDCYTLTYTTDVRPDSIRIVGAEGAGQAFSGCYPNPDMLLNFSILPVIFGDISGKSERSVNVLDWSTSLETNSNGFEILRSGTDGDFVSIGMVQTQGNGDAIRNYSFTDLRPLPGHNYYKVRHVDNDGAKQESSTIEISYQAPSTLAWAAVGPVPTNTITTLSYQSEKARSMNMVLTDLEGNVVESRMLDAAIGLNSLEVDLSARASGVYFLRLAGSDAKLTYKLMKF